MSLWYILIQRLCLHQSTVIELDTEWFLFHDRGVSRYKKDDSAMTPALGRDIWVLVDSNDIVLGPWWLFRRSRAFIVQATSPRKDRYDQWTKEIGLTRMWTMDVWSLAELDFTSQVNFKLVWTVLINCSSDCVWNYPQDKKQALRRSFDYFGPAVRVAQQCILPEDFESRVEDVVSNLPVGITAFTAGLSTARNSYDTSSHRWCLVTPNKRRHPQATFVSEWAMKLIMEQEQNATADFLHAMYQATAAIPAMGVMAGKMFEAVAHTMLWNGQNTATGLGHSGTFLLEFTEDDRLRMSFTKVQELGNESQADGTWPEIYAQPIAANYATADSVAIIHGRLHIFQMTTNYLHTINIPGLEKIYNGLPADLRPTQETPLRFVWVIPFDKSKKFGLRSYVKGTEEQNNRWDSLMQQYVIKLTMAKDDFISKLRRRSRRTMLKLC